MVGELSERIERMVQTEQQRQREDDLNSKRSLASEHQNQSSAYNSPMLHPESPFIYSSEDFGPPLSSSFEVQGSHSTASTPPAARSFARMAMQSTGSSASQSGSSWGRKPVIGAWEDSSSIGWKLEIPDTVLTQGSGTTPPLNAPPPIEEGPLTPANNTKGFAKKKKPTKVLLIGNAGSRGSFNK
jgi:hypothetical protein